jgi:hypothetical protein
MWVSNDFGGLAMTFTIHCIISIILVAGVPSLASVPQQLNYQGYLTDTSGNPPDTTVFIDSAATEERGFYQVRAVVE